MIDLRHPLAVLATRLPSAALATALSPMLAKATREHETPDHGDLVSVHPAHPSPPVRAPPGRPRLPIWLMCSLLYLKHAFTLSDEQLCERWAEIVV